MIESKTIPEHNTPLYDTDSLFDPHRMVNAYVERDFTIGFHAHKFFELNMVAAGSGDHYIGTQKIRAQKGDVFIIPPYQRHAYVGGEGFDVYHFISRPDFLNKHLASFRKLPHFFELFEIEPILFNRGGMWRRFRLEGDAFDRTVNNLSSISRVYQHDEPSTLVAECYAVIAIASLCEEYGVLKEIGRRDDRDDFFVRSVSHLFERYREGVTVEELAEVAGLSRSSYLKRFCSTFGVTPHEFVINERIKEAKNMLAQSNTPINDIAELLGFYDASHFHKCFKRAVGSSPAEYRKNKR